MLVRLALGECRHWLEGTTISFVVWTDHENLEYIQSAKQLNARKARWAFLVNQFIRMVHVIEKIHKND